MPIIVEHKETGDFFVLIGSGFGAFQSAVRDVFNMSVDRKHGTHAMVCVCDRNGNIGWLRSEKIKVINVHGTDISELHDLGEFNEKNL